MQHMLRFKFSMFGALQWKRDMADYQEAASRLKVQRVTDAFDQVREFVPFFQSLVIASVCPFPDLSSRVSHQHAWAVGSCCH